MTPHEVSPEIRLILSGARPFDEKRGQALEDLLSRPLDWERFLDEAHRHGMSALIFWHFNGLSSPRLPAFVMERLRGDFVDTARKNLWLLRELFVLLDVLAANGIPAIPHKGPVLGMRLYNHPGLRPSRDLDILVPAANVEAAASLLLSHGYRPREPVLDQEYEARFGTHRELVRPDSSIVELHWTVFEHSAHIQQSVAELWTCAGEDSVLGRRVAVWPPEMQLTILCVHGCKHEWERIEWLCDVAKLAEQIADWRSTFDRAHQMHTGRMVFLGLALARDLLGVALPPEVSAAIDSDRRVAGLVRRTVETWDHRNDSGADFKRHLFFLTLRERWADRFHYLASVAGHRPSERDRQFIKLPKRMSSLYPAVRVARIGWFVASNLTGARGKKSTAR